jgi:hypothetical protein
MMRSASPLEGNTTDWRAGCGRSASPVRREGEAVPLPTPIVPARGCKDGRVKPGHDGFAVTLRLPGESTFRALGIRARSSKEAINQLSRSLPERYNLQVRAVGL